MGKGRVALPQGDFGAHQAIGGLPVQGHFYDEVVPSAKELTQIDTQRELLLPKSCRCPSTD
ncbi:hypothetical protein H5410_005553 [Solanum commersonii]|uniref:Uncharacterized protein n=1 Tax=Solanum commersonii TaxID=4109 RepID=A0A9J6A8K4_SOLCO|nr:hypothetical protein H5410_005553 [Solanum commersonii]